MTIFLIHLNAMVAGDNYIVFGPMIGQRTTRIWPVNGDEKMKVYDLEHHCYSKEMLEQLYDRTEAPYCHKDGTFLMNKYTRFDLGLMQSVPDRKRTFLDLLCDLSEWRIEEMDKVGVDVAVLSTSSMIEDLPREESINCAKITNDTIASVCKAHPNRFFGTIALPMPYVDDALDELERAKKMGLRYVHTHSSWVGGRLSDDQYIPILARCEELGMPIYIHPTFPQGEYLNDSGSLFVPGFGFSVDVMKTAINLVVKGRFDQFPKLRIVLGHMAEYMPYVAERMDNRFFCVPSPDVKCKHTFDYYIRNKNFMMTTSGVTDPEVAMFVIKKYGVENIMFGSDFPYESFRPGVDFIKSLPISDEDKEKIFYKNAEKYIFE